MHAHKRPYLLSYGGSLMGDEVGIQLRNKVYDDCGRWGELTCHRITSRGSFETDPLLALAFHTKNHSTFCMEPGGYV